MMWFWLELSISPDSGVCQTFKKKRPASPENTHENKRDGPQNIANLGRMGYSGKRKMIAFPNFFHY